MATTLEMRPDRDVSPAGERLRRGLHGHSFDTHQLFVAAVEALGTFVLVLAIIGAAIAATLAKPIAGTPFGSLTIALSGGLALMILVATLGPISGAHFNPAVTVSLAAARQFPWSRVPAYVVGQFVGAVSAALVAWWFYGSRARDVAHLGATTPAPGVSVWRAFGAEAIVTLLLVFVIVVVATGSRHSSYAPYAIGAALATAILVSGPISGGGVNPARAIGPMIVAGSYRDWWVYLAAPILGATVATLGIQLGRASSAAALGGATP